MSTSLGEEGAKVTNSVIMQMLLFIFWSRFSPKLWKGLYNLIPKLSDT
jgi:hypothetical protein